ncbi:MAG: hypothetical protein MUO18_05745 [Methanomassiliicoccales archaeon]|nr:hypothetical protein [Methanomassiliicoccales archaeon]
MTDEDTAAIEYAVVRALKNFETIMSEEEHALIRMALRQGRLLSRVTDEKERIESLRKVADSLIVSREKVSGAWNDVNVAVANLQKTYASFAVKQLDSITSARLKFENFLGRASGLSDILEGVLHEAADQGTAQKVIERLSAVREKESKVRQATDQQPPVL